MPFAENLKYLRDFYGLSNYQLAKELGCHQTSVANWIEGAATPQKKHQKKIAERFGLTVEELNGLDHPHIKGENKLPDWPSKKQKKPTPISEGELDEVLIARLCQLTPDELQKVDAFVQGILSSRKV